MVLNTIFNTISVILWLSALLVEETGVTGETHWPAARHWQTLSHNVVHVSGTRKYPLWLLSIDIEDKGA